MIALALEAAMRLALLMLVALIGCRAAADCPTAEVPNVGRQCLLSGDREDQDGNVHGMPHCKPIGPDQRGDLVWWCCPGDPILWEKTCNWRRGECPKMGACG